MKTVLVDMDSVIADFEGELFNIIVSDFPHIPPIRVADRNVFHAARQYHHDVRDDVMSVMNRPGFFARLQPIDGSIDALNDMMDNGVEVFICTSPLISNPTCASDKIDWISRHLGSRWNKRVVIANDKTLVRGDILVDDRPVIDGHYIPVWEHVIFDQPYNRDIVDNRTRLMKWDDWQKVLLPILES